ncbi:hypothetical protein CWS43_18355 [Rahnella sp. AA]|nr:hypothetical protein CWS43_18355 [Rahnella sp. AA]
MKNVVVLGDKTSHGDTVISASSTFEIEGKNAALLNDNVSCPEHGPAATTDVKVKTTSGVTP